MDPFSKSMFGFFILLNIIWVFLIGISMITKKDNHSDFTFVMIILWLILIISKLSTFIGEMVF